jgi:hypothetical protein
MNNELIFTKKEKLSFLSGGFILIGVDNRSVDAGTETQSSLLLSNEAGQLLGLRGVYRSLLRCRILLSFTHHFRVHDLRRPNAKDSWRLQRVKVHRVHDVHYLHHLARLRSNLLLHWHSGEKGDVI